jgi:hypothetical protein
MSAFGQPRLPGHPGPPPEALEREEQISNAFVILGKTLQPILENLPRGSKSLTIQRKIAGFRYRVTIEPVEEK